MACDCIDRLALGREANTIWEMHLQTPVFTINLSLINVVGSCVSLTLVNTFKKDHDDQIKYHSYHPALLID